MTGSETIMQINYWICCRMWVSQRWFDNDAITSFYATTDLDAAVDCLVFSPKFHLN